MTDRSDNFNRANSSSALGTPSDAGSDWVELATLAEAYGCETDAQMVETAASARQVMWLIDEVINVYFGRAQ